MEVFLQHLANYSVYLILVGMVYQPTRIVPNLETSPEHTIEGEY